MSDNQERQQNCIFRHSKSRKMILSKDDISKFILKQLKVATKIRQISSYIKLENGEKEYSIIDFYNIHHIF